MTPSQAFEKSLSKNLDSTVVRGKLVFSLVTPTTPAVILTFSPTNFGARASAFAGIFSRYRFKYVRVKALAILSSTALIALGIQDDVAAATGETPTTVGGVTELRCSATIFSGQSTPTELSWEPVDKHLWYYTATTVSGDPRLDVSAVMWAAGFSATAGLDIEVDYCLVFQGATDPGAS